MRRFLGKMKGVVFVSAILHNNQSTKRASVRALKFQFVRIDVGFDGEATAIAHEMDILD